MKTRPVSIVNEQIKPTAEFSYKEKVLPDND